MVFMLRTDKERTALGNVTGQKLNPQDNKLMGVGVLQGLCSGLLSVAGINAVTKNNLGRKGSILTCWLHPIKAGSQSRNLKQKAGRPAADPLPVGFTLSYLSHAVQAHLLKGW